MSWESAQEAFESLQVVCDELQGAFEELIFEAVEDGAMNWVRSSSENWDRVERIRHDLEGIQNELALLSQALETTEEEAAREQREGHLRRIRIEVSKGMINQSLLTLTPARNKNLVRLGERFEVELPDGTVFSTQLIEPGNKLRERSRIKSFYLAHDIKPGDSVFFFETAPGHWKLQPPGPSVGDPA